MAIRHFTSLLSLLALLATTSAVKTPFNASFDDLQGSPNARLDPVGICKGISFSDDIGVSEPGIDGESLSGVMPHSNPNIALASGASSLSVAYSDSKVKSFALDSLYYGCNTGLEQGEVETAVACTITVTAYRAGSTKPAATETFEFTPAQPIDLMNAPTFGTFSSGFQGLEYANITFTPSTAVLLFDNLVGYTES